MPGMDTIHWPSDPEKTKHIGSVPGAFSIPILRNPGGEAISSVGKDKSRNYTCMSGEFSWESGWSIEKNTTLQFLKRSGFMYSEDWEDYCPGHNGCEVENIIDWHADINAFRKHGDPEIPKKLKHPFKKCTSPKSHDHQGTPNKGKLKTRVACTNCGVLASFHATLLFSAPTSTYPQLRFYTTYLVIACPSSTRPVLIYTTTLHKTKLPFIPVTNPISPGIMVPTSTAAA